MNKNIFQSIIFQININNRINNPISIENYLENNEIDNFDLIYKIENTDITVDNRLYLQRINEIQNLIELKKKFLYFLPISLKFDFNKLKTIVKRSNQTDFSVCILNHQLIKNNKDNIFFIIYRGINLDINIILKNSNSNNFNISLDKEIIDIYNQKYQLSGRIENIPKNKGEFIAIPLINDDSICVDFSYTDKLSYLRNEKPIMYANKKENNIFNFAQITDVKSEHIYDIILLDIDREYIVETINSYTYIPIDNKTKKNVYDTYKDGIKIKKYTEINISGFKSGIYLIDNKVKMIIKDHNNPIVFVYPSNTENIYNNFGGKCGYFKWAFNDSEEFQNNKERATQLSFHRPCSWMSHRFSIFTQTQEEEKKTNITDTQHKRHVCEIKCHARKNSDNLFIQKNIKKEIYTFGRNDHGYEHTLGIIKLLRNFQVNYISDIDLECIDNFKNTKLVIIGGHNEYVTLKTMENIKLLIKKGINFMSLSGNTMSFEIEYGKNNIKVINDNKKNKVYLSRNDPSLSFLSNFGLDSNVMNSFPTYNFWTDRNYTNVDSKKYTIKDKNNILLKNVENIIESSAEYDAVILKGFKTWFLKMNNYSNNAKWVCRYFKKVNNKELCSRNALTSIIELDDLYNKFKYKKLIAFKKTRRIVNNDTFTGIICLKESETSGIVISFGGMNMCNEENIYNNKILILNSINILLKNNMEIFN